jgi:CheY-like chemotaxis protein
MSDSPQPTILLVEDEPMVRSFMVEALRRAGLNVLEAGDAEAAWAIAEREECIDAMVTDVRLPGMSGPDLLRRLRQVRPDLPALYVTGYAGPDPLRSGDGADAPCLPKPFRASDFVAAVRQMIAPPGAANGSVAGDC